MLGNILGGRYKVISQLGRGGFGATFVAEDKHLPDNPRCVVKHLKPQFTDGETFEIAKRLFETEAKVLYKLGNFDQIPRLLAHFEENREFYLVQELIEGENLSQELRPGQQFSESYTLALLQEILNILKFVHQHNIIHRDIKPSNIIRRLQDRKPVLIDFGAVKQIGISTMDSRGQTTLTIAIGSPGYIPNEQMAGKPRFSSDIYAVGMMGILALTGVHPRNLPEDSQTGELIWRNPGKISPDLAEVLDKMVRYDFRDRYQSATEALEALNAVSLRASISPSTLSESFHNSNIQEPLAETLTFDKIISEKGIDYKNLQDLLAGGQWKAADRETAALMLIVSQRETQRWLDISDVERFPVQILLTIDRLWLQYSQGHFGFSVQKKIWENLGGTPDASFQTYCSFCERVGWRLNEEWLTYGELTFNLSALPGHLPGIPAALGGIWRWGATDERWKVRRSLLSRRDIEQSELTLTLPTGV